MYQNTEAVIERLDRIEESISSNHKEQWLNIRGVAKYSSLSISKLRRAVAGGELKASKRGGRLLFKTRWVDKWLNG
jgi:excisionase family DNA binding protein|tara:strand:+ start:2073 stop:2300 length:228 start_codon:yes stop_codon:yes gene_type:complete